MLLREITALRGPSGWEDEVRNAIRTQAQEILAGKEGRVYSDIVEATGASTATISRVKRSLEYGCDSYSFIFERMVDKA